METGAFGVVAQRCELKEKSNQGSTTYFVSLEKWKSVPDL